VLRDFVRAVARHAGFELHRYIPARSQAAQLEAMLAFHRVNLVFDVGANAGQFGRELRHHIGYRGRIVSFEPLESAHRQLRRAAAADASWIVADRAAIGSSEGEIEINVAANSVSSSALPMLDAHVKAAPDSAYTRVEKAKLHTLDSLAGAYLRAGDVAYLKVDTQGYESEVLKGAQDTLARVKGLQLEISLVQLYHGQKLFTELLADISAMGFVLWGLAPAFADPASGQLLQVDATFFREDSRQVTHA
jgi:FkbM family methyltransferase